MDSRVPWTLGNTDINTVAARAERIRYGLFPVEQLSLHPLDEHFIGLVHRYSISAPFQVALLVKPYVQIEDIPSGTEPMIRRQEYSGFLSPSSDDVCEKSIQLAKVVKAQVPDFQFPRRW